MPRPTPKERPLGSIILKAVTRELVKLQEETTGRIHDGWTGSALATWVAPGVTRTVQKLLAPPPKKPKRKTRRLTRGR